MSFNFPGTDPVRLEVVPDKTTSEYQVFFANGSDIHIEANRVEYGSSMIRFYLDTQSGYLLSSAVNVGLIDEIRQVDRNAEDR